VPEAAKVTDAKTRSEGFRSSLRHSAPAWHTSAQQICETRNRLCPSRTRHSSKRDGFLFYACCSPGPPSIARLPRLRSRLNSKSVLTGLAGMNRTSTAGSQIPSDGARKAVRRSPVSLGPAPRIQAAGRCSCRRLRRPRRRPCAGNKQAPPSESRGQGRRRSACFGGHAVREIEATHRRPRKIRPQPRRSGQRAHQQPRSPDAFRRQAVASKIPLVAEDQRPLWEFAGVVLALEHFVVVRPEQNFGPQPAQLCAHDPAVNQPEGGTDAPEKTRNRKRVLAGKAAPRSW
jgi:hypothetical protein